MEKIEKQSLATTVSCFGEWIKRYFLQVMKNKVEIELLENRINHLEDKYAGLLEVDK